MLLLARFTTILSNLISRGLQREIFEMAEEFAARSASTLKLENSEPNFLPKNVQAKSSILKPLNHLVGDKTQSNSVHNTTVPKAVSIAISSLSGLNLLAEESNVRHSQSIDNLTLDDTTAAVDQSTSDRRGSQLSALISTEQITVKNHGDGDKNANADPNNLYDPLQEERIISITDLRIGKPASTKFRPTKFMKKYPELFRDDVSVNPSYTGLRNFPYNVVCRRRSRRNKLRINHQLNTEIENITLMQTLALDGVRVNRIFTVGFPAFATIVPDFATPAERRRLNKMLSDR